VLSGAALRYTNAGGFAVSRIDGIVQPLTVDDKDDALFRDSVRQFAERTVAPRVREMDRAQRMDPEILRALFDLGLMGIEVPSALGGSGAGFMASLIAIEELAVVDPAVSVCVDVQNTMLNNSLLRWGTMAQQQRYLPQLTRSLVGSYALSEPSSGSDAFALTTRAVPDGDVFRLTGTKQWITNGAEAGLYLLFATVDPAKSYKGITAFLIERESPGFSVGKREDKLGIRASSTVSLHLNECIVPRANVLGEIGSGYKYAIESLNEGRIGRVIHSRAPAVRQGDRRIPSRSISVCAAGDAAGGRASVGLQRCAVEVGKPSVPQGSGDGEAVCVASRRTCRQCLRGILRRRRLYGGLSRGKVLPRR